MQNLGWLQASIRFWKRLGLVLLITCLTFAPIRSALAEAAPGSAKPSAVPSQAERTEILDLISRYSYTWDGRDVSGWVGVFTADAVLQATFAGQPGFKYSLSKELTKFIEGFYAGPAGQGLLSSRHFQTNTVLEQQSDGSVQAHTMFAVTFQYKGEPTPRFSNTGVYRDRLVKTANGWKIARRDILVDQELPTPPDAEAK